MNLAGPILLGLHNYAVAAKKLPDPHNLGLSNKQHPLKMPAARTTARKVKKPSKKTRSKRSYKRGPSTTARDEAARHRASSVMANFLLPRHHYALLSPVRYPTPRMAITSQTTGTITPDDNGRFALIATPGSLLTSLYNGVTITVSQEGPDITSPGTAQTSQIYDQVNDSAGDPRYRVTSAALQIHYIGDDDDNGGEFVVNKFKPKKEGSEFLASLPSKLNSISERTHYLPAKKGVEILFFAADNQQYTTFEVPQAPHNRAGLEGAVVWLDGANTADKQKWRYVLTQTVECIFGPETLMAKMHRNSGPLTDEYLGAYSRIQETMRETSHDVSSVGEMAHNAYTHARDAVNYLNENYPTQMQGIATAIGTGIANYYAMGQMQQGRLGYQQHGDVMNAPPGF